LGRIPHLRFGIVKVIVISPSAGEGTLGNSVTANRWASILQTLGHTTSIASGWNNEECDLLIALHARRSHSSIERFRQTHPERPLIVALTGTDIYNDLPADRQAQRSVDHATRVVVLQSGALDLLGEDVRRKTCVIYQSAVPPNRRTQPAGDHFAVCVLSHLREVKDPLRAALASRLLPASSKVRIVHAGRALDQKWEELARREERENSRYRWIGEQSHEATMELLASCHLCVLSSAMEGGANAIAEAVVCGVPVLCSDVPGNVGMLGRDYTGYFRRGDTAQLAAMLHRAEVETAFMNELRGFVRSLQERFSPEEEVASWDRLLRLLPRFQL
jgi:putative glycosyltransferase (TIGR04348 family)